MHNLIIMGSGRSGTSLMAGLFSGKGYHQGERLLKPSDDNSKGFFEDREINRLNEELMKLVIRFTRNRLLHRMVPKIPLHSNGWMTIFPFGKNFDLSECQKTKIKEIVNRQPFCYKDPRFSFTYPAWKPFLVDTTQIVVFRNPAEVCASIMTFFNRRKARYSPSFIYLVWENVYSHILKNQTLGGKWTFVNYADILSGKVLPKIEQLFDLELNRSMIDPNLNRSQQISESQKIPNNCKVLFDQLVELSRVD